MNLIQKKDEVSFIKIIIKAKIQNSKLNAYYLQKRLRRTNEENIKIFNSSLNNIGNFVELKEQNIEDYFGNSKK